MFILYHNSHLRCLPLLTQLSWSPFAVRHKSASSSLAHLRSLFHITFLHSIFFRNFTHIFSFLWIKLHKLISACHFLFPHPLPKYFPKFMISSHSEHTFITFFRYSNTRKGKRPFIIYFFIPTPTGVRSCRLLLF